MTPETTDIQEFEQEILVQGHPGAICSLASALEDQFVSSGKNAGKILFCIFLFVINASSPAKI